LRQHPFRRQPVRHDRSVPHAAGPAVARARVHRLGSRRADRIPQARSRGGDGGVPPRRRRAGTDAGRDRRRRQVPALVRGRRARRARRRGRARAQAAVRAPQAPLSGDARAPSPGAVAAVYAPARQGESMTARPNQPAPGPLPEVPGHRVLRVVGEGGMSTIYLGLQLSLGREVAIKVMRPEALADEVGRRRFENEARTIARLEHPHIVGIHEVGRTADGLPWYSMPWLPRGHVGQRDLSDDPGRVREVLPALAYAHARGVVHRDVKAENVLFDEADRPLLADFGIALRRGHGTRVTMTGLAVGSTAYMAPEQARGEQVDPRADLYSVGVLA